MTQLKAKIAKKDSFLDGLSSDKVSRHIHEHPNEPLVVVAIFDPVSGTIDYKEGVITPKVAMRSNEVLTGERAIRGRELMEQEYAERTGQQAPPLTLFDSPSTDDDPATDIAPAKPRRARKSEPQE